MCAKATFPETTGQESIKPLEGGSPVSSDMRNALSALFQGDVGALRPRAQATPDMTIAINPAVSNSFFSQVWGIGNSPFTYAGGNTSSMSAPSVSPRIDIVYLTAAGALAIVTGTEAGSPVAKWASLPKDGIPLCLIYHKTTETKIVNYEDKDIDATQGYIYQDVRPTLNLGGGATIAEMQAAQDNIALLAFRLAVVGSLSYQLMEDGVVDEYEDQTGIDDGASTASYDASGDYYANPSGDQTGSGAALSGGNSVTTTDIVSTMSNNTTPSPLVASDESGSANAWKAFDDNDATYDQAGGSCTWIKLDFGSGVQKTVVGYALVNYASNAYWNGWHFQGSNNGTDWTDLDIRSGITAYNETNYTCQTATGAFRYYRFSSVTQTGTNELLIKTIKLFEGLSASNAFDDSDSTYWGSLQTSGSISGAGYIGYDFGVGVTKAITGFTIKQHAANQAINSVKVQRSDNGSSWTDVSTVSITADNSLQTKAFSNTTAARYWRLLANAETASDSWEVEEVGLTLTSNLDLRSEAFAAEAVPTQGRIVIFEEDVDAATVNTDILAYISRDGGSTYSQVTLVDEGDYETSKRILAGTLDISGQPSGSSMKYKITTANLKAVKIHGASLLWKS